MASLLIVTLKIIFFAMPWFTKIIWDYQDKQTNKQRIELVGNYIGTIQQFSSSQTKQIGLRINSENFIIKGKPPFNLYNEYQFDLDSPNFGGIRVKELANFNSQDKASESNLIFDTNEEDILFVEYQETLIDAETGILKENEPVYFDIEIEKFTEDSLIFYFTKMFEKRYKLKLKTKR